MGFPVVLKIINQYGIIAVGIGIEAYYKIQMILYNKYYGAKGFGLGTPRAAICQGRGIVQRGPARLLVCVLAAIPYSPVFFKKHSYAIW